MSDLRESILEAQIEASFQGHDLGPFEQVTDRVAGSYQAECRLCKGTFWVGDNGLRYSLLEDKWPRPRNSEPVSGGVNDHG